MSFIARGYNLYHRLAARRAETTPPPPVISFTNSKFIDFCPSFSVRAGDSASRAYSVRISLIALVFLLLAAGPVSAATITVGSTCSLSDALLSAAFDSVVGGCAAGSGADTIELTGDVTLSSAYSPIDSEITINGNGYSISGADAYRVFSIDSSGNLTINRLTIRDGSDSTGDGGSGIRVSGGTLTLNDSVVRDNSSTGGGTVNAGGISVQGSGTATINRSAIHSNEGTGFGGGINLIGTATVTINRSSIYNNSAGPSGGGIHVGINGAATVNNSSIYGNSAQQGGGARTNSRGTLKLNHVTITDNTATATSGVMGGGLDIFEGTLEMRNSIVFGNNNQNCQVATSDVTFNVNSGNIIGDGSTTRCSSGQSSDDPLLQSSPSGSPPYYALNAGSPAIDAATCLTDIPAEDQRGMRRPQGSACDIGAIEFTQADMRSPSDGARSGRREEQMPPPTPSPTPRPMVSTCTTLPAHIRVSNITQSTQCQQVSPAGVGDAAVLAAGFVDAVDVWGWVLPDMQVCFAAAGGTFQFIDTTPLPRVVYDLPAVAVGDMVCATIDRPGIVVLQPGPAAPTATPMAAEAIVERAPWTLSGCMVRTQNALNLRAGPGGAIIGAVPYNVTLTAFSRTADWFEVDWYGTRGWLKNGYLVGIGACG